MNRFAKRRAMLASRHKCTRCGAPAKPDCRTCPDCLAEISAKRMVKTDTDTRARERARIERRRALIRAALVRLELREA